jgi:uncharacterized membrane protein
MKCGRYLDRIHLYVINFRLIVYIDFISKTLKRVELVPYFMVILIFVVELIFFSESSEKEKPSLSNTNRNLLLLLQSSIGDLKILPLVLGGER